MRASRNAGAAPQKGGGSPRSIAQLLMSTTALIPAFSVMATAGVLLAMPSVALAQTTGGRGGNNNLGSGGASSETGVGGDGAGNANSGGGGGAGVTGGRGGNGGGAGGASAGANGSAGGAAGSGGGGGAHGYFGATVLGTAAIGGSGGAGAASESGATKGGGGGGAGGFGAVITGIGNLGTLNVNVSGGTGGLGGTGSFGGYGGSGGVGLALIGNAANLTINRSVIGGNGGSGGAAVGGLGTAGVAGNGGVGLHVLGANSIVTIGASATVTGGNSGPALNGAVQDSGGIGITGSNLTLIVGGFVSGGTGVFGRARAVSFTGGTNVLELQTGATFIGDVVANSAADTLRLGGATDWIFNASLIGSSSQFRNFGVFEKVGAGTTTLTGSTSAATPWAINGGTLSIASDGALGGSGPISFNGGTLATTALFTSARNMTLNAGGGTISPATATSLTLSGIIGGTGALTKADAGLLILTGANSYAGGTLISGGTLSVGDDANLGAAGTGVSIGNATFRFNNNFSTGRAFTLTGTSSISVDDTRTGTITGIVGGAGSLTKASSGTLVLTGDNSYAGTTTINAGVLQIGDGGTTGTLGLGDVTNNATLIFARSNDLTIANAITGSGAVIKNGAGTVTLTGQKAYTNRTTINAGTLALRGTLLFTGGGPLTLSGGTLDMGVDGNFGSVTHSSGSLALGGKKLSLISGNYAFQGGSIAGGGTIALLGNSSNFNISLTGTSIASDVTIRSEGVNNVVSLSGLSGDFTLGANLDGSGASGAPGSLTLNMTNAGFTTTISGNNNHRAGTTVNAGTLAVGSDTALGTGTLFLSPNTVLTSVGLRSIANPVNLFANGIAIRNTDTSNPFTLGGVISNAGFTKTGAGTLTLTGANTYTAGTTVSEGTLQIGAGGTSGALGSGAVTNNAILVFNRSDDATFSNIISGTGTLRKLGAGVTTLSSAITQGSVVVEAGTLALSAANTITGITVAGGTLRLGASGAAGGAGGQITTTGSVIDYANGITTATPITINSNTTQLQVTTGAATQSGAISEAGGARPLEKIGAGELNLTGINTYSGGTTISAGTLSVFADTGLGAASGGVTISNARLQLNNADTSTRAINLMGSAAIDATAGASWTLGGGISGTGSLTKGGAGTLVLSGNNTYAGTTTITDGSLRIGAGGTTGTLGVGAVTNNASLVFNRSNDLTVANLISGTGSVTKLGAGVLTLSAINAYSGGTTISAGTLQLGSGGQNASLGSGPVSIATGASLRFDGSGSRTVSGAISGGGSVTVGGTAIVRLLSTTGSYTGGTTVNSGILGLSGATSAGTGLITMNGGTLRALASLTLTNELTIPTGALVVMDSLSGQTLTLSNQPLQNGLNLNGTLRINGGTVQFSATNATFAENAQLLIFGGTLRNTPSSILPTLLNTISLTELGFGTLDLGGQSGVAIRNLQGIGTLINDGATTIIRGGNFAGSITGTQNIISTGAFTLSGISNFSGTTLVQSGTLTITHGTNALGSAVGGTIVQNGATLATSRFQCCITIQDAITVGGTGNGGIGALRVSTGAATTFNNSVSLTADTLFTSEISGFEFSQASTLAGNGFALTLGGSANVLGSWTNLSSLTKNGSGNLTFSGTNTFTGPVFLNEGAIVLQGGSALADTVALTIGSTASLTTVGLETIGSLAGSGQVFLSASFNNPGTLSIGANNTATEYSGRISFIGALTKVGTSTLTLSGDNSWEGVTTISAGTLQIGNGGTTGTLGTGNVVNNASLVFNRSNDLTVANLMSGGGSLTKQGAGTLILAGNNSYSGGTTISGGTLQLGSGSGTPGTVGSGPVSIASGAILRFDGAGDKIVAGAISGGGSVVVGGSGTATLNSATGSYAGGTTVNSGTLALAGATSAGTGMITMNGGALQANASFTLTNRLRVSQGADTRIVTAPGVTLTKTGNETNPLDLIGTLRIATTGTGANAGTFRFSSAATTTESARLIIESGTLLNTTSSVFPAVLNVIDLTQIDSAGTLNLGGITFGGADGIKNLRGSGTLINNGSTTVILSGSFSGNISGTQNIISTGVLELSGASTFSGTASVQSGTLTISSSGGLGTSAGGTTVRSGATLALAGAGGLGDAITFGGTGVGGLGALRALSGTQTLSGNITLMEHSLISAASGATLIFQPSLLQGNAQRLTFDTAGTITANTSISNVESLTKNGSGLLTLGGTNTSIGSVVVNAGTLRTQNGGAIADNAAVTVNAGATLDIDSVAPEGIGSLAGSGFITVSNASGSLAVLGSSTTTFSGQISGVGGLNKSGTGTLTLTGTNSYARITDIFGGTLVVQGGAALPDAALLFIGAGATLRVEAGETIGGFGGAGNIVLATTGPLIAQTTDVQGLSGVISQSGVIGSFTKRGIGQQILSGANTYTGLTSVEAGILNLSGAGALASTTISTSAGATLRSDGGAFASSAVISHAGTLALTGSETIGSISGAGAITLTGATLTTGNANDATLSGIIGGTGALAKTGSGTLTLSGANTYQGGTTVSAGTLVLGQVAGGNIGAAGTGTITFASNAVLQSSVTGILANSLAINAGVSATIGAAGGRTLTLTGNSFVNLGGTGSTLTFGSSTMTGQVTLDFAGAPTTNVAGAGAIAGGTVQVNSLLAGSFFGALQAGMTVGTGATSATLNLNGINLDLFNLVGSASGIITNQGAQAARARVASLVNSTYAGVLTNGAFALNLVKSLSGTLTLTGDNSYTGTTTIDGGTLQIGAGGTSGSLGTGAVTNSGSLVFNRSGTLVVSSAISGTGVLTQSGPGITALTGANNYSGATTISAGTLQIGNGGTTGSLGSGAVTNNATLAINLSSDITLAQAITGTGALRKLGTGVATITSNLALGSATVEAGTLTLSGSNSFTNGITVAGGTLALRSTNAAGGAAGIIRTTGSVIDYSDGLIMVTPIQLNSNTTQLQVLTGTATQSGVISEIGGARPLEKIGAGTLTLAGVNSYSGGTVITAGRLNVASSSNLGNAAGGLTIGNAVLGVTATFGSGRAVSLTGAAGIDIASGASLIQSGLVSGLGGLTKTGAGTLFLTANNSYAGTTTVNAGDIIVGGGSTTGTLGTGNVVVNGGSALQFNRTDAFTVANIISGAGLVAKQGTGVMTLTGANTFSGALAIAGGAVVLDHATGGVIDAAGTGFIQLLSNTTLRSAVSGTLSNSLSLRNANVTVAAATGTTLRLTSSQLSFDGPAGSSLNFGTATATGTVDLAPALVSLGTPVNPININGGTLRLSNANAVTLLNGSNGITLNGATLGADVVGTLTKPLTLSAAGGTIDVASTSLEFSGANTFNGVLTKTGTGDLRFSGATTGSSPVQLNTGMLSLLTDTSSFGTGTLQMATGTTLRLPSAAGRTLTNDIVLGAGAGSGIIAPSLILSGALSGGRLNVVGGGPLAGSTTLILTGNNSYGTTSIATGNTLQIGNSGLTGTLGTGAVQVSGTLAFNRSDLVQQTSLITGAGTINQNGTGTLNLGYSNITGSDFTGTINVNSGILLVSGSIGDVTARTAQMNVASGATLAGTGTFNGNVVVANGGILGPGTSPGTQTIAGNLVLNDSSILNFELAQPGAIGGIGNDLITVGGNLVLDGTLNVTGLPGFGAGFYRLFNYGGTLTNNQLTAGVVPMGFTSSIFTDIAGQVNILFNAGTQTVQYWDGADLTGATATVNGEGGAGNWSSTSTNWTTATGFAVNGAWAGQTGVFAGAAGGIVSVTGTQAFQELRFLTDGYTLNPIGPTGGLATTGGFSIINVDTGISTRLNTPISGLAGLTKTGAGTLTLAGANTFSGLTTVASGTLSLLSSGVIAGAVQNNATLTNGGTIAGLVTNAGTLTSTGTLGGGLVNNAGATANVEGGFGGSAISNSGTLTLTGATTGIGAVTQNAGGALTLAAVATGFGSLAGTGNVVLGAGGLSTGSDNASTSFAGVLSGAGGLTKQGAGTFTLSGMHSYAGLTSVTAGTLALASGASLTRQVQNAAAFTNAGTVAGLVTNSGMLVSTGTLSGGLVNNIGSTANIAGTLTGAVTNSGILTLTGFTTGIGAVTINGGGALNLAGFNTAIGSLAGAGAVQLGAATLTTGSDNASTTFSGGMSGSGALTKTGSGTLTLSGANSFAGLTTLAAGGLVVDAAGSLTGAVQNAGILTNSGTIGGLVTNAATLSSTGTLNGGLANNAGAIASVRGALAGAVTNSGTITLTGTTTGNGAVTQASGGTVNLAGFNATIGSLAGSGSVQLGSGTLTLGGANASTDFAGVISGSGALVKTGTATQTLSGANSFAGLTTINQGSISLATGASLAGAVQNNAIFISAGTVAGLVTNAGTVSSTGTLSGGLINNAGATANLANILTGAVTNSGSITLTAGLAGTDTLTQNTGGSFNLAGFSTSIGSISGTGSVQLGGGTLTTGSGNASTTFDGIVSGSGALIKTGTGTLTLGGSNTTAANFTGNVSVNSGTLLINGQFGDTVASAATLSVANGATLGGSGNFLGNIALGAGSILAPGNSPGTLAIAGNLLLDSTSVLNFELAQAGVVGGGINDLITVGGNLTLDGTLNVTTLPGFGAGIYRLFNYGGALTDNGLALGTLPGGFTSSLVTSVAGQISIQFVLGMPTILYWDGADATGASAAANGDGGAGTWNSAATNWTSAPGFNTNFAWGSQTGVFAGAAGGAVSIAGTQAFQQLRFETGGYTLSAAAGGGGLATTGGLSIIDVSAGLGATINAPISGTAGLTKAGTGTLTLGGANSYTGLTSIAAGTLAVSAGGALAGAVENNATFTNAGTVAGLVTNTGSLTSTGALNGGLSNAAGATSSLAGTVTGAVSNAGTITLTGATTGIGALTQTGTGSLNLAGFSTTLGSLAGSGSVQLGSGTLTLGGDNSSTSFTGVISGNGGLTKAGTGMVTLSGANSYAGLSTINAGTLALAAGGAIAGAVQNNASFTNAGTVAGLVTNAGTFASTGTLGGGLTNAAGAIATIAGQLNGTVTNSGTITLTGATTGIGAVTQNAGATLNLAGFSTSIGGLAGTGSVQLGSGTLTLGSNNISTSFAGGISGLGGLTKTGTGTLTLASANSFAGLTTINQGAIVVSGTGSLAGAVQNNATLTNSGVVSGLVTNAGSLVSGGRLDGGLVNNAGATASLANSLSGTVTNSGTITLTGGLIGGSAVTQNAGGVLNLAGFNATLGSLAGTGAVQLGSGTLTTGSNNASTSFAGIISGSGGLTKTGTGTLTLSAANSYGGLTLIGGGALTVTSAGSLAGTVVNNATLNSTGTLNGRLTNEAGATANISGALNNLVINRGTLNLTGTTTGIGELTMATGSVFNLGGFATTIGTLAGSGGTVALGSATLTLGSGTQSQTYDGTITGTGGLTKVSANTFSLSGAQSYTGLTSINGGTFILGNNASLAGALVNNATVSSNGRIAGLVTNNTALISTGALNGGLVNAAGATANLRGTVAGAISNAGTITLTGATAGIGAVTQAGTGSFVLGSNSTSFGSLAGSGTVRLANGAVLTTGSSNSNTSFAGVITGAGGLTKIGTGTFTLTGANDFTGLTTVNAGSLVIGTGGSLAGGVANNASFTNAGTVTGAVVNAGILVSTGTLNGALTNNAGALVQLSGQLNNAVTNAGNIALTGATTGIGAFSQVTGASFDLAGNSTSVGSLSGAGAVQLGSAVLTTGADNASTTFAGAIAGAGGLTKTGTGTFTLTGANTHAGLTTVAAGALNIQTNTALGTADGGTIVNAGAALELQGGITVTGEALTINGSGIANGGALRSVSGNNLWAGTVTLGSDSRIVSVVDRLDIALLAGTAQNLTIAGVGLTGINAATSTGTLTVLEGSTALFGSGNFAAGVTVNGGALFLQGGTSINDAAAVTLGTGNLIVAVSETIGSLAGGGTVQIDAGQSLTLGGNGTSTSFGGVIFNTGNLVKQGAGTFTATGTLAHTGTTSINGGTLLSGAANLWQGNGLVTIAAGGTLDLGGFDQSIANIALAGGTLTNGVLAGAISSSGGTINGITGAANALVTTAGTTTLTGAGSFALGVTLSGGDLSLQGSGASIDDAAAVVINAGTLTLGASETIGSLAGGAGRIQLGGATLTTGGNNASTGFAGVISGPGGLTKAGSGIFTLSGTNSYTGLTTVSAGVLALATGGTIAGAVQNTAGFSNAGTVAGLVTNARTLVSTGTLNGGLVNSGGAGLAGVLNGAVSNSGLVQVQGALTGIGAFSQTATGMFDLAGFNTSIGSLSGAGSVLLGSATLTTGGNSGSTSFGGLISGTGGLVKTGTGTFTLTSGHSFTGLTTVSGGTLAIANTGGLTGSVLNNATFNSAGLVLGGLTNNATALLAGQINGPIANNGTITSTGEALFLGRLTQAANAVFNMAGFNTQAGSLAGAGSIQLGSGFLTLGGDNSSSTFAGVIGGSGGLVKIGTGTFTLSGVNSYGGTTFVNAGTLVIGDGTAVPAPVATVASIGAVRTVSAPAPAATPIIAADAAPETQGTGQAAGGTPPVVAAAAVALSPEQAAPLTRADLLNPGDSLGGGRTPASLTSSAAGIGLSADLKSGPERVDLFAGPGTETAITAPVLAAAAAAPAATVTLSAAATISRPGMISALGNGLGTASLDGELAAASLDADAASAMVPGPEAVSLAAVPTAGAENAAQAGPISTAVIAGNVVNRAIVINNGTIRGQLANGTGATTTNNGVILGTVFNDGLLVSTGTLSGGLSNNGTARIQGVLTGDVFNAGAITLTGTTTGIAVFQQAATGSLNLAGFDTTLGVLTGAGTIALGSARLTTGTNGITSLFSGVISGSGGLTMTGTDALILTGENLYTGGTTITAGRLQLGDGGASGSILGPITNNGTLIVNRNNAYTLASVISGSGMFAQRGRGTTTLTGANSYTGGTLINAGRLVGSTTSLQGLIQNDAVLEFAQAANGVFAGRIGGSGLLEKTGAGLLELTGDNSALRGATTVRSGELRVTGALSGSFTTVLADATLSGIGTLGGLIARSGSVVSPGNGAAGTAGIGMLGFNGPIVLQSGSTLRLQIHAVSGSDMLVGNSGAQIGGTAAITNLGGTYAFNSNYLLAQASSGRTGTFENVTGLADFGILYRPELVYTANQVLLRMAPNRLTNIVGNAPLTANQRSVVSRIDAAVTAGYNPQPLFNVYSLPTAQLPGAFDQLSGEIYATAAGVGIEQERLVREAVLGRIGTVASASRETPELGTGAGAWAQLFGSWGDGDGDGNASRFENDRQGFITGIDYGSANSEGSWRIGAFGLNMTSKVSVDRLGSRAEVEQTGGGIYAGVNSGGFSVATGVAVTGVDLTSVRTISLPGFAETNRGRGDGKALQGFAELSYSIEAGRATYRPFVSAAAGSFKLDAMTENGGAAALVVRRQSYASGSITAGIDGTICMDKLLLSGTLAGRAQIGDRDPQALVALAAAPAQAFGIRGVQLDSFALAARLDATVSLGRNADLAIGYTGLIGNDTKDHGARATLSIRF